MTRSTTIASLVLALTVSSFSSAQVLPGAGYEVFRLGLTGPDYSGSGDYHQTLFGDHGLNGHVAGATERNSGSGYVGFDAWVFQGDEVQQIGLIGPGYEYSTAAGIYRSSTAWSINDHGIVGGYSERHSASGTSLGSDAWVFDGNSTQPIGLAGAGYETAFGGGVYRNAEVTEVNNAGTVLGANVRVSAGLVFQGRDPWLYNGSYQLLGLTGVGYEYDNSGHTSRHSFANVMNEAGQVMGDSSRYSATGANLGRDVWFYDGNSTQLIGLTGSSYEFTNASGVRRVSGSTTLTESGKVVGDSERFGSGGDPLGTDSWLFDGTTTQFVGLTGAGYEHIQGGEIYRQNDPNDINEAGQVRGRSERFSATGDSLGRDAWFYDGSTTQAVGLIGAGYEYDAGVGTYRWSASEELDSLGHITGDSRRFSTSGGELGDDSWHFDGNTTRLISPVGGIFEYTTPDGIFRAAETEEMNALSQVIGEADRFSATGDDLGEAAWFYDYASDTTHVLDFSQRQSDGFSNTEAQHLTGDGAVLGRYELFSGDTSEGLRAFWWSAEGGFHDLGSLASGDLSSSGWDALISVTEGFGLAADGGSPQFIIGRGVATGQTSGESFYLLEAIPAELDHPVEAGQDYSELPSVGSATSDVVAKLRGGTASANQAVEASYQPGGNFSIGGAAPIGDVLSLTGTGEDTFILEVSYSETDLAAAGVVDEGSIVLKWFDETDSTWKNAVAGNNPATSRAFLGTSLDDYFAANAGVFTLGDYGNDPLSNTVWAVLNHNSLYAISTVPEPTTLVLAGIAGTFLTSLARHHTGRVQSRP